MLPATGFDTELGLRQLATMLEGGLTLTTALKTCADQARRPAMALVWNDIFTRIANGQTFAEAAAAHPRRFSTVVIQLIKAGEQSGTLPTVLEQAADQLERRRDLIFTLTSALMYPTFAVVLSIGVAMYLVVGVVPEIGELVKSQGKALPPITQALLDVSDFLTAHIGKIGVGFVLTVVALVVLHRNPATGPTFDRVLLRLPIFGKLLRLAGTAMFARGLALLLNSGVPLLDALSTAGGLLGNRAMANRTAAAREALMVGRTLAPRLLEGGEFLPMLGRMTAVGEETGALAEVLESVAKFHEKQLAGAIKTMSALIEPVVTVVVGGIVGFIYLAFFMALYSFAG
jgi:type IV pilus assembly protein PilC